MNDDCSSYLQNFVAGLFHFHPMHLHQPEVQINSQAQFICGLLAYGQSFVDHTKKSLFLGLKIKHVKTIYCLEKFI